MAANPGISGGPRAAFFWEELEIFPEILREKWIYLKNGNNRKDRLDVDVLSGADHFGAGFLGFFPEAGRGGSQLFGGIW
jgi:hypothetical protein